MYDLHGHVLMIFLTGFFSYSIIMEKITYRQKQIETFVNRKPREIRWRKATGAKPKGMPASCRIAVQIFICMDFTLFEFAITWNCFQVFFI